jgi:hypothetical protein
MSKVRYFVSSALLVLAGLGAARADGPTERERLVARDPVARAEAQQHIRDQEAIHMLRLQQWNDARQLQLRALSNLQASHHETVMLIIDNMRPSGRYEYNPVTGRYDRYVPYSPRK